MRPARILFITTGLLRGGAETVLCQLTAGLPRERFEPIVLSLRAEGPMRGILEDKGIQVVSPGMNPGLPSPAAWYRLRTLVRGIQPDVIQGWMYHGNVVASWVSRLLNPPCPVLFSVHNSIYDLRSEKRLTACIIKQGAKLSTSTRGVIYCAHSTAQQHEALGYDSVRTRIIANGFDIERFVPDSSAGEELRHELQVDRQTTLVGLMARFDRHKGHDVFCAAARLVADQSPATRFVLAGRGITESNPELRAMTRKHHVEERLHLLGERSNMPELIAGLDVLASASTSEAFPIVLGEALSCGTLCAATDVGDTGLLVDGFGEVVPPRDPVALSKAILGLLRLGAEERHARGLQAREHIVRNYSLDTMVQRYAEIYQRAAGRKQG